MAAKNQVRTANRRPSSRSTASEDKRGRYSGQCVQ